VLVVLAAVVAVVVARMWVAQPDPLVPLVELVEVATPLQDGRNQYQS